MPTEIRNISLVADNSVFPPEVSLSNEVITRVFPRNPVSKCIRHKCKIMKNICGYISCGCCCNSNCSSRYNRRKNCCNRNRRCNFNKCFCCEIKRCIKF